MSNALSACGTPPCASLASAGAERLQIGVLAIGVVLLLVWVARRAVHPKNLRLSRSPGRANTVELVHIIVLLVAWLGATSGVRQLLLGIAGGIGWGRVATSGTMILRAGLLAQLVGQVFWLAASLFVAARTFPLGLSRGLGLSMRHWFYDGIRALVASLAVRPVCFGLSALCIWLLQPHGLVREHGMLRAMDELGGFWCVLIGFSAVVMAPLAEEVFFRGLLQSMLRHGTGRPWLAVTVTSAAFAAIHYSTPQDVPALFALSVVLGYNYERTGRLVSVIAIHAIFNGITFAMKMLASG